jgi:toxin ParE1/3/4
VLNGNYLVLYRIRGDVIDVLHIMHGARDYEANLFAEE